LKWISHKIVGAGTGILLGYKIPGILVAMVTAVVPDIVELGILRHRGWSHGWWVYGIVYAVATLLYPQYIIYINYALLGITTHLITDALTMSGIPMLPFSNNRLALKIFRTGSVAEYIMVFIFIVVVGLITLRNPQTIIASIGLR